MDADVKAGLDKLDDNQGRFGGLNEGGRIALFSGSKKKNNMYQLVYNEMDENDERFGGWRGDSMEGDGDSSDLHLTPSQRVSKILGRSDSDAWSTGKESFEFDTELRISSDQDFEDTFETQLTTARMLHQQLDALSPISSDKSQNCFENNADFSRYPLPFLHSTPIKRQIVEGFEMNPDWSRGEGFVDTFEKKDVEQFEKEEMENRCPDAEHEGGLVRFFKKSLSVEKEGRLRNEDELSWFVSPTLPKCQPLSLASRLRQTLSRPLSPTTTSTGKTCDLAVKYSGPPRYDLDPADCYIDDDFCRRDDGPDPDYAKMFVGVLQQAPGCADTPDRVRILTDHVQFNVDDDYEDALSQDPSKDVVGQWSLGEVEAREKSSRSTSQVSDRRSCWFVRDWTRTHKRYVIVLILITLALLFVLIIIIMLQTYRNVS